MSRQRRITEFLEVRFKIALSAKRWEDRRVGGQGNVSYDRLVKLEKSLSMINSLKLPLIRAVKPRSRILELYYRRQVKPIRVFDNAAGRTLTIIIDLPATRRPVAYHIYVSTQESCPIYPKQLEAKKRKLFKEALRFNAQCNRGYYIVCERGYTVSARKTLRKNGILPAKNTREVLENMAKYFKKRYNGLLNALRGKRLFGELTLLVYMLQEIVRQLADSGENFKPLFKDEVEAYHAVENGIKIS